LADEYLEYEIKMGGYHGNLKKIHEQNDKTPIRNNDSILREIFNRVPKPRTYAPCVKCSTSRYLCECAFAKFKEEITEDQIKEYKDKQISKMTEKMKSTSEVYNWK